MRALLRLVSVMTALLAASGCELAVPFNDESQPCGANDECVPPSKYVCKHDAATDAGTCKLRPDGG